MKKLAAVCSFLLCTCFAYAQQATLKGIITDTTNKENLGNAVVSLLRSKDSVLYTFARSKPNGEFQLNKLAAGNYLLLITYPHFADYADKLTLTDTSHLNLQTVKMTLMANLLKEVFVQQQIAAVRIKGDTLEFKADSFKVREGASVEEMLKKLPGIQVDKDGKITAQGEKVQKVLVDGEEFFGDDPTIATKNLQADAIDKVQVYDKKSDQAAFTGIDDGQKTKTINLKMKEDKKKGYFGKLDLGGSVNDKWNNTAMINRFRAKKKFSAYGIMSSTGKTGLDWQENNQYGGGNDMQYDEDMGYFYSFNDDEFNNSSYNGQGLPKNWSAGLQYSNKYNDDKQSLNGSYRYNKINTEGNSNTFSQSILPDTIFYNREQSRSFNSRQRHAVNGVYEWQIDSSTSLKITAGGYTGTSANLSDYSSDALNADSALVNKSTRTVRSSGDNQNWKTNLLLRKKFAKAGRTIALSIDQQYTKSNTDGYLNSVISSYNADGTINGLQTTDQRKVSDSKVSLINSKITYTEPLIKNVFAEANYAFRITASTAERLSYDKDNNGKYQFLNDTFSNNYKFNVLTNTGGLSLKYNSKKLTLSGGSDIARSDFKQTDLMKDTMLERNYTNFFPRALFAYKFGANTRLSINYNGNTKQPTIQQIQPVKDNSNPLIQVVGNPLLKQEFTNRVNVNFNSYKVLSQRGIYLYGSYSVTSNAIVNSNNTNDSAITTLKYINTNGNHNGYGGLGYGLKLKKLDTYFNFGLQYNTSRYNNIVNNVTNITDNNSEGVNVSFYKYKEKKFSIGYSASFNYNMSKSSIRPDVKTNYWTQSHNFNFNVTLPLKLEINSEVQADLRQKTALFDHNNDVVVWNAYLGRKVLKKDKGMIKISGYDILNQNKGYNRYISSNVLREENYQTISRYFMLSFVWNFMKNPAGVNP